MRAVGLVPNRDRPLAHSLATRATTWLTEHSIEVRIPMAEAVASGLAEYGVPESDFVDGLDLVVSLGGDGTMLHTAALVFPNDVPVLGVNAGNLGYLNAFEADDLEIALAMVRDEKHSISRRVVLKCVVESDGAAGGVWHGLNEVVLEKLSAGRMVRLAVAINGQPFTSYAADGVVVATPTGSTAYSFSLRGPIVSPTANVLLLTPISPHMLFDRSLVLSGDETIDFTVTADRPVSVNIDGRPVGELATGDRVRCTAASQRIAIVAAPETAFHQILKAKFELPDR